MIRVLIALIVCVGLRPTARDVRAHVDHSPVAIASSGHHAISPFVDTQLPAPTLPAPILAAPYFATFLVSNELPDSDDPEPPSDRSMRLLC